MLSYAQPIIDMDIVVCPGGFSIFAVLPVPSWYFSLLALQKIEMKPRIFFFSSNFNNTHASCSGSDHLRDVFAHHMGLSDQDIVALSGGHTLVSCIL